MSPFFSSHREHAQPPPTTTTTTDDEKTNRTVWCSLISLFFLPELSYGFLFLSCLSCFFAPFVLSLSFSRFYLLGSFGLKTKNQALRVLDDKQTRESERGRTNRKRRKLSWRQHFNLYEKKHAKKNILAFDQLYIVLSRTGLYDKREKNEKRIYIELNFSFLFSMDGIAWWGRRTIEDFRLVITHNPL
jgi:hypothetical protein